VERLAHGQKSVGLAVGQRVDAAGLHRVIPSMFGMDFHDADPGSCLRYDSWRQNFATLVASKVPYTIIHTNGFFQFACKFALFVRKHASFRPFLTWFLTRSLMDSRSAAIQ
jgi:hypothetical protein